MKAKADREKQLEADRKAKLKQAEADRKAKLKAREDLRKEKERAYKQRLKQKEKERLAGKGKGSPGKGPEALIALDINR